LRIVILLVGMLIVAVGAVGMLKPATFRAWLDFFAQGNRLYAALLFRIVAGVALVAGGASTRMPQTVFWLGVLFVFAGISGFFMGVGRLRAMANWWAQRSNGVVRGWALMAVALGTVLVYAAI
jgi:hypothetical protein